MERHRIWVRLAVTVTLMTTVAAAGAIWLVLSRPVEVAEAVQNGSVAPLVRTLAAALTRALWTVIQWL